MEKFSDVERSYSSYFDDHGSYMEKVVLCLKFCFFLQPRQCSLNLNSTCFQFYFASIESTLKRLFAFLAYIIRLLYVLFR